MVRRLLTSLLGLSLSLSAAEANIADVHDGDAPAGELARTDGPIAFECISAQWADPSSPADSSGHVVHVCHAGHAHTGWMGTAPPVASPGSPVTTVHDAGRLAMADFDPTPAVRPPIA